MAFELSCDSGFALKRTDIITNKSSLRDMVFLQAEITFRTIPIAGEVIEKVYFAVLVPIGLVGNTLSFLVSK